MTNKFSDERFSSMEAKLNGALGRLMVPAMQGNDPTIKEAQDLLIEFAGDFNDLINDIF